jgi:dGTPase
VRFSCLAAETNAALKRFLRSHIYFSEPLVAERRRSASAVAELFQFFMQNPDRLPEGYQDADGPLHRTVCDYIAGMTDGYFRRVYQQMMT